jgi:predicted transcriptional regulator
MTDDSNPSVILLQLLLPKEKTVVDVLRVRQVSRISQVHLSELTGISRPRLSAAENGYLELNTNEVACIRAVVAGETKRRATKVLDVLERASA